MGISVFPAVGGVTQRTTDFTSSGTWVCPAGVYSAEFLVVGAGGGGGGTDTSVNTQVSIGGGGGGGAVLLQTLPTVPGSSYTITIGAKGTGGNATAGTSGGASEVVLSGTTLIKAFGGAGGGGVDSTDNVIYPAFGDFGGGSGVALSTTDSSSCSGGGGSATANAFIPATSRQSIAVGVPWGLQGSNGGASSTSPTSINSIGLYGVNNFGSGGNGAVSNFGGDASTNQNVAQNNFGVGVTVYRNSAGASNGNSASYYGCGGGGGLTVLSTDAAIGGDGYDGIVRITYFA
jgi:trimeric autotransporter adhesin